jgi:hypothetical protein
MKAAAKDYWIFDPAGVSGRKKHSLRTFRQCQYVSQSLPNLIISLCEWEHISGLVFNWKRMQKAICSCRRRCSPLWVPRQVLCSLFSYRLHLTSTMASSSREEAPRRSGGGARAAHTSTQQANPSDEQNERYFDVLRRYQKMLFESRLGFPPSQIAQR